MQAVTTAHDYVHMTYSTSETIVVSCSRHSSARLANNTPLLICGCFIEQFKYILDSTILSTGAHHFFCS